MRALTPTIGACEKRNSIIGVGLGGDGGGTAIRQIEFKVQT